MLNTKYLYRHLFLLIFWAALWFVVWIQIKQDLGTSVALLYTSSVMVVAIAIAKILSDNILPKALKTKQMKSFILQAICFTLLLALWMGTLDFFFIYSDQHLSAKERITPLLVQFYKALISSLLMNGTACGIRFYQEHADIQQEHNRLEQLVLENQIKSLQDQINPHFMFNVLNHIQKLMKKNIKQADYLLLKFSDMLRYQLYESNLSNVLLSRELQYLEDFITIEKIRCGDWLTIHSHCRISTSGLRIVPLILIRFVENAFKHVALHPDQLSEMTIDFQEEKGWLRFTIRNSGQVTSVDTTEKYTQAAFQHITKRLNLHYANKYRFTVEQTAHYFTQFVQIDLSQS